MAKRELPSPEVLRQLLRYEPDTGKLFWLPRTPSHFPSNLRISPVSNCSRWNAKYAGKEAMTALSHGYRAGTLNNEKVMAHNVCWALAYGAWPTMHIDHANGDPLDNRISNLRLATRSQNNQNVRSATGSSSCFKGVTWDASRNKWIAGIKKDYKRHNLGRFDTAEEAARAHDEAAVRLYGAFARLNFPRTTPSVA